MKLGKEKFVSSSVSSHFVSTLQVIAYDYLCDANLSVEKGQPKSYLD